MPLVPVLRVGGTQATAAGTEIPVGGSVIGVVAQGNGVPVSSPALLPSAPIPTAPAVPASTTPQTNTNSYPVTVVITGGTGLTSVVVNGVQVGTTAGTYTVPAGGTIAITYTSAPTWTWANPNVGLPGSINTTTTYVAGATVPVAAVTAS